jgi:hypothetical protein
MITRQDNANATCTTTTYDPVGQTLQIWHTKSDGSVIERAVYSYDPVGNPEYRQTQNGHYTWLYDALNQLTVEHAPVAGRVTWSYDPGRNRSLQVSGAGWTTYTYDPTDGGNIRRCVNPGGSRFAGSSPAAAPSR